MSFIWMILAGVIPSVIAKLLMPARRASGIFILGVSGSLIVGLMQYAYGRPIGFVVPLIGACILLAVYAVSAGRPRLTEKSAHDDIRRAA
jgi:uncharacterized membrane protein YeaQ/YmgE (transglycosylase-associated protein family)